MRDVEVLVAAWRASVTALFKGREDVLDELESHLWDEIDRRVGAGDNHEQAFRAATAKLGHPAEIATEFAKVPVAALPWLPVRLVWTAAVLVAVGAVALLGPKFGQGGVHALLAGHMGAVMLGYLSTLLVGCLAACFLLARLVREPGPGQRTSIKRAATALSACAVTLTGAGVALGSCCPFEKTGWCCGLDTREVGGIIIAAWDVIMLTFLWGGRRSTQLRALMVMGMAGSVVVVLGWLGAARVENHFHGPLSSLPVVAALTAGLLAVSLTALAPAGCLRSRQF